MSDNFFCFNLDYITHIEKYHEFEFKFNFDDKPINFKDNMKKNLIFKNNCQYYFHLNQLHEIINRIIHFDSYLNVQLFEIIYEINLDSNFFKDF